MRLEGGEEGLRVSFKEVIAVVAFQRLRRKIVDWGFETNGRVEIRRLVIGLNRSSLVSMSSNSCSALRAGLPPAEMKGNMTLRLCKAAAHHLVELILTQ